MARGPDPRQITRLLIWGRAAGRCQFRNCRQPLDHDLISGNLRQNKAYIAHIVASDPNGKRGDPVLSPLLADDPDNLMLMCDAHHREIDGEETWRKYPVEFLREMKAAHENWVETLLSAGTESRSHVLQVSAPIGPNETAVRFDDCFEAIAPLHTLAEKRPIEIKIRGLIHKDSDPSYWPTELNNLRAAFARDIRGRFSAGDIKHLSVFSVAPIPLLMELGRLLSDLSNVSVFQLHREPKPQWKWASDGPRVAYTITRGAPETKSVALKLSLSDRISDERVSAVMPSETSIWEISCKDPNLDMMRHPEDLSEFRRIVRRTFNDIKHAHGGDAALSIFPAIPVSCAVEFGRVWQPKAHLPFDIYDQPGNPEQFRLRHRIETA